MKGSDIPKRRDVILSVATLALALLAAGIIVATASTDEFVACAWTRHHNILSWYVRPLFILPFCFFAYRRSLTGIVATRQLDRFLSYGVHLERFRKNQWYAVPSRLSAEPPNIERALRSAAARPRRQRQANRQRKPSWRGRD